MNETQIPPADVFDTPDALTTCAPTCPWRRNAGLLVAVGVIVASHVAFVFLDYANFSYDDGWYAECALHLQDALTNGGLVGGYDYLVNHALGGIKAPLILVTAQPTLLIFGRHDATFVITNVCGLAIAMFYLAALARLFVDRWAATLAALVFALMPLTADMSRQFFVEIWLANIVMMFIYHLLRSEGFTRRGHALLAGLAIGLGLLAKITFPLFVGVIALVEFIRAIRRGSGQPWRLNCLLALLLGVGVALPWYLKNGKTIIDFAARASFGDYSLDYGPAKLLDLPAITTYWVSNVNVGFGAIFLLSLAVVVPIALIAALVRRDSAPSGVSRGLALVAAWLLPALIMFTVGRNRTTRFILPLLPGMALLYALLIHTVARRVRPAALLLAGVHVAAAAVVYFIFSFGGPIRNFGPDNRLLLCGSPMTTEGIVDQYGYPLVDIVQATQRIAPVDLTRPRMGMLILDTVWTNHNTLTYTAEKIHSHVMFGHVPYSVSIDAAIADMDRADVLIWQDGGRDFPDFTNVNGREVLARLQDGRLKGWRLRAEPVITLPDGGVIRFFERG